MWVTLKNRELCTNGVKKVTKSLILFKNVIIPGDNTEKIWVHWSFAKQTANFQRHVALFKPAMYIIWIQFKVNLVFLVLQWLLTEYNTTQSKIICPAAFIVGRLSMKYHTYAELHVHIAHKEMSLGIFICPHSTLTNNSRCFTSLTGRISIDLFTIPKLFRGGIPLSAWHYLINLCNFMIGVIKKMSTNMQLSTWNHSLLINLRFPLWR